MNKMTRSLINHNEILLQKGRSKTKMFFFSNISISFPRTWSLNKSSLLKYIEIAKTVDLDNKYKMKIK